MASPPIPRSFIVFALLGGLVSLVVGLAGSLILGIAAGLVVFAIGFGAVVVVSRGTPSAGAEPADASRRRFLVGAGLGGLALAIVGAPIGWMARKLARPDPRPVQQAMAKGLGSEYMELVRRAYHPGRSGDLQLLLAPFNSSNYANESVSLVPQDPRSSHASVWMYLERIPLVVYGPGIVVAGDNTDRVTLADLAPTTAELIGAQSFPTGERQGVPLPLSITRASQRPKVVMTFVIDGGGWNVLTQWPDAWPNLRRSWARARTSATRSRVVPRGDGVRPRHDRHGRATQEHGITGHNIRDAQGVVRKAYGEPARPTPPTSSSPPSRTSGRRRPAARRGSARSATRCGTSGMVGYGGRDRADGSKPVAVYWDETGLDDWAPQNPDLYRLHETMPSRESFDAAYQTFWDAPPDWDDEFTPQGRQAAVLQPADRPIRATSSRQRWTPNRSAKASDLLLYTNFKSPDYTGHIYRMASQWERLRSEAVDVSSAASRRC